MSDADGSGKKRIRDGDGDDQNADGATHAKKAREEPAAEQIQLERDEEFWYEDGTIYLTAGNVVFKAYRGPLVEHSPVFRDMFSLPQPPTTTEPSLPHPVVPLPDSPQDLRHLLRALMPSKKLK